MCDKYTISLKQLPASAVGDEARGAARAPPYALLLRTDSGKRK